ncbi:adapter protein CIKS [Esox lucius]|uniref:SEFIR domain-containing protein n=1 Tax=Esox lucius TaxID=8010 RepID=A0A3P9ABK8_ESOLU|nr:adapter protein CIKS [Esox lucius]
MDYFRDSRHRSIPVETDESMTSSTLDLVWPSGSGVKNDSWFAPGVWSGTDQADYPKNPWRNPTEDPVGQRPPQPRSPPLLGPPQEDLYLQTAGHPAKHPHLADLGLDPQDVSCSGLVPRGADGYHCPPSWPQPLECSLEGAEHLEAPLPLRSDLIKFHHAPPSQPAHMPPQCPDPERCRGHRPHTCQQHVNETCPFNRNHHHHNHLHHVEAQQDSPKYPAPWAPTAQNRLYGQEAPKAPCLNLPQRAAPPREVMNEVSVVPSYTATPNQPVGAGTATQEIRRTVSLPEECRTVFITYSVDIASEMFTFVKFLTDQGFKPAIDIFNSAVLSLDMNKWMDTYLNDKSVLIIVVISPKYKADVEGNGEDEHGLHTKYIHTQIQNEFIQQRCLNFRLVPVLFPTATKRHVPAWLQSTRIYRWPQDTQDLLLRLLREERYIAPPLGKELTLSIRPV